ncbi:hypothetical protein B0H12DRAFT_1025579 [Mycena haematopus]|nr:hypothetical protein B0H12DRAFT_1025579 [Mycena haematopus]
MRFLFWDGRYIFPQCVVKLADFCPSACRALIDAKRRLFACLGGRPRPDDHGHDNYARAIDAATQLFAREAPNASGNGRRGAFVAVTAGVSYGTGQLRPGVMLNTKRNAAVCATMVAHWAIRRIAGFSTSVFQAHAPTLYQFYKHQMRLLFSAAPHITRLFPEAVSVFAACTFNFGPRTVTFPHVDAANLAWGWCCITALGQFDPDLGGHLILWDLNLVIRFPPGSTIMIPSALLCHSNVSIQQNETRYSFTQYTAGSLFRWVHNGNRSDADFFLAAGPAELAKRETERAQRWENGLKMFEVWP